MKIVWICYADQNSEMIMINGMVLIHLYFMILHSSVTLTEPLTDQNQILMIQVTYKTNGILFIKLLVACSNVCMNFKHSLEVWWTFNFEYNQCISPKVYVGFIELLNWPQLVCCWPPLIMVVINRYLNSIAFKLSHLRWKSISLNTWKSQKSTLWKVALYIFEAWKYWFSNDI